MKQLIGLHKWKYNYQKISIFSINVSYLLNVFYEIIKLKTNSFKIYIFSANDRDIPDLINRQVEANEIGRKVAAQVFNIQNRKIENSSSGKCKNINLQSI